MASPTEQITAVLTKLHAKADLLAEDVADLLMRVDALRKARAAAAEAVTTDQPFSVVVAELRELKAAAVACSETYSRCAEGLEVVQDLAVNRVSEVANG